MVARTRNPLFSGWGVLDRGSGTCPEPVVGRLFRRERPGGDLYGIVLNRTVTNIGALIIRICPVRGHRAIGLEEAGDQAARVHRGLRRRRGALADRSGACTFSCWSRGERDFPIFVGVAIDREPPRIATPWRDGHRTEGDRYDRIEWRAGRQASRSTHLKLPGDLKRTFALRRRDHDWLPISVDERKEYPVWSIRLVPGYFDLDGYRGRYRIRSGDRPASTKDVELAPNSLRGVR